MTTYSTIRASDSDRENVVEILRDAYTAGRLTLEEFDERTTAALTGRTWGVLGELTRDLPRKARLGTDLQGTDLPGTDLLGTDLQVAGPAGNDPPGGAVQDPGERMWRILPLVPVAAVWLVIALSARMPDSVVPVIIALLLLLRCTVRHRPASREAGRTEPGRPAPRAAGRSRLQPAQRGDPTAGSGSFR